MSFQLDLRELRACKVAIDWTEGKTKQEVWDTCPYASWLDWQAQFLYGISVDDRADIAKKMLNTVVDAEKWLLEHEDIWIKGCEVASTLAYDYLKKQFYLYLCVEDYMSEEENAEFVNTLRKEFEEKL